MNNIKDRIYQLTKCIWIFLALSVLGCAAPELKLPGVTPISVALREDTAAADVTATAAAALATIQAVIADQTTPALPTALSPTPDDAATAAAQATAQAEIEATLTSLAPIPTATPDLAATAAAQATEEAAINATLTALAPTPTDTPMPTPNLDATAAAERIVQAAIQATLTALAPTITPTPTPNFGATQTVAAGQVATEVARVLTAQAPTATPFRPPTNTPRAPQSSGLFTGALTRVCTGEGNMTWFEGTVYVNNQPANGYRIVFKSYLVPGDEPATAPAISGPHEGYRDWPNGYYAHIVNDHFTQKHLEVWIIGDGRQPLSNRVRWDTDGTTGPCNKAVINFHR